MSAPRRPDAEGDLLIPMTPALRDAYLAPRGGDSAHGHHRAPVAPARGLVGVVAGPRNGHLVVAARRAAHLARSDRREVPGHPTGGAVTP